MAKKPTKQSIESKNTKDNNINADNQLRKESLETIQATADAIEHASGRIINQSQDRQYLDALNIALAKINDNLQNLQQKPLTRINRSSHNFNEGCCDGKDCLSVDCCEVDFIFKKARMTAGQIGIDSTADGETTTGIAGEASGMEVQFYAALDGVGIIVPNQIWRFMKLDKRIFRSGVWYDVDRLIRRVSVPCKGSKAFKYNLQVVEREVGRLEDLVLGKNEFGTRSGTVNLSCCENNPIELVVPVVLDGGGLGRGEVEVMFEIKKTC